MDFFASLVIPVLAIVLGISVALWSIYWAHQTKRLQYEERRLMIEKGMAPPAMPPSEDPKPTPEDYFRRGIIMVFLAVGFAIGSQFLGGRGADGLAPLLLVAASIVGLLGLGKLVYYLIAKNRTSVEGAEGR